ncbi:BRO-N domain-containing protein [Morganella morganii]|uniref:BRO-N domain-containing protein n=1 Tax=Morganella morganii TaxID=582 RepID=UPI00052C9323|nr:BRO family protein [Morganella morganii]KGP43406.1 antirepressor protein [Morganella morganii]HCR3555642.1 antirepressor protein [Morganella morganii]HCR3760798.1 antirepressor protein [Morganella morganii]HCT5326406.1 antirepressor protein [Morganella morganii]HDF2363968.1 antirepressor protein [Morganella morganii]
MENLKSGFNATSQTHPEFESDDILNINSDDISFIRFEGVQVRIVKVNNEPWFIAKDVCNALELTNSRVALLALDSDEKNTVSLTYGIKGNPKRSIVSESGFYKLIARSRKATTKGTFAHRFTNWVFRDVIPSIRKTGAYGVPFGELNDLTKRQQQYKLTSSQRGRDLQSCKTEKASLQREEVELWRKYQPDFLDEEIH